MKNAKRLKIENLNKTFITNKNQKVVAVNNINLDIEPGEFVTILGPSGCGKTTTLRMIAGFEMPTEGKIYIGDEDVASKTPDKRDTAMVFQNYALFPHMNVFDNIAYGLKLQKLPENEIKERVSRILKLMKMEDFATRVPSQMSGGQQQRVSLARALVMESGILLFDEPLSNLDAKLRIHMRDEIRRIQKTVGITSVYVTHDQSEAMGLSDKIVIMNAGNIEQVGNPIEIYQKPKNEFVANFIGKANIVDGIVKERIEEYLEVDIHGVEYKIKSNKNYKSGDKVRIVIRPEAIDIFGEDFTGVVTKSIFMGQHHEYEVEFFGEKLEISYNNPINRKIHDVDDKLSFSFDTKALHIF
ncbi:iron(III) transport system ATP-binding protein [Hypnocyclicus thermotrophus]|uniref:Iron(III) transport system ATP-binding protein n=1 Tax=Hypnocyclicus thermotrophus TaxID=1627895 RepID=A0AA46DXP3_9FUSO|nr:ABC transporter ATP-binding protein [Hypnocyclicus thermotrophus]TDT68014.1 iron(III) transport system ATP-binding protein [Hypnocyclicus thermotrophus]